VNYIHKLQENIRLKDVELTAKCLENQQLRSAIRDLLIYAESSKFSGIEPVDQRIHKNDIILRCQEMLNPYFITSEGS
jgi:hypothetical protein